MLKKVLALSVRAYCSIALARNACISNFKSNGQKAREPKMSIYLPLIYAKTNLFDRVVSGIELLEFLRYGSHIWTHSSTLTSLMSDEV